jgi:glyoxylate reductase
LGSVLLTTRVPSSVVAALREHHTVDASSVEGGMPRAEMLSRVAGKDALIPVITDRVDDEVLDAAPNLKIIANIGVGYDNIDAAAARRRGVIVTNTPNVLTDAVAELTWGLILGVARRLTEGDRVIRAGKWNRWSFEFMLGAGLSGKQLGIIGRGRIGRAVAAKAPAFGMTAVFARRETERGTGGNRGDDAAPSAGQDVPLDQLLVTSDVISIHTPGGPDTKHLINRKALARMKRSAFLVNTARGSVIDEEALIWALNERLIAGAALDVFEREPDVPAALKAFENVLLVPHLGSATRETRTAMADLAARNVIAVLSGNPPLTPVP